MQCLHIRFGERFRWGGEESLFEACGKMIPIAASLEAARSLFE